jgi:hypothetical protein
MDRIHRSQGRGRPAKRSRARGRNIRKGRPEGDGRSGGHQVHMSVMGDWQIRGPGLLMGLGSGNADM